jgi:hypothetical protein
MDPLIQLAERVAAVAAELGIATAVIYNPGLETVQMAEPIAASSPLRCATLRHLIALKLYAGRRQDQADVVELLRRNPRADHAAIREVCARYGSVSMLDELLLEV